MEELYFTSNDGELSYVETDGGILLEQGSQGYLSQADQGQQNIIYTPQVSEQQVYIIQQVQHPSDNQQYIYGTVNSPQVMHGKNMLQNVQTGSSSNEEYAAQDRSLSIRQPVQHRIVQVVQQQPTLQLSNSHVIQIPMQSQQHITLSGSPITYIQQKTVSSDSAGKLHLLRQPLNVANIQAAGPRGAIRLIPGQPLPYSVQQTRPTRPYIQRPQNSVSVTQHQPVIVQNATNSNIRHGFQENYLKQIEYKVAMQSKGRGGVRANGPVAQQRRSLSQKFNTKLMEEKGDVGGMQSPPQCSTKLQGLPTQVLQKNFALMGTNMKTPVSQPQQETKNMNAFVHVNSDKSYSLSITEDNPEPVSSTIPITVESVESTGTIQNSTNENKTPIKKISLEQYKSRNTQIKLSESEDNVTIRETQPPSFTMQHKVERCNSNVMVVNNKKMKKVYYVKPDSNVNKVLSATTTTTSISQQSFGTSEASNLESLPDVTPTNLVSTTTTNFVASANTTTTIQNFTIAQDGNSISPTKHTLGRGTLVVCGNCGIETETLPNCSGCKRPLNKGPRLLSFSRKISTSQSNVTNTSLSSFISNAKETSNDCPVSKQDFYGKANIAKIIPADKKPTLSAKLASSSNRGKGATRGKARGRPRIIEEYETVTISSEDDDDENSTSSQSGPANFNEKIMSLQQNTSMSQQISNKEPNMDSDSEDLLDSVANISVVPAKEVLGVVSFNCRSIRIGSYKYFPSERVDVLAGDYIRFKAPSLAEGDQSLVTITIHFNCVSRLLCHFGMTIPVIYLYIRPSAAKKIRQELNMNDVNQCYFDPTSEEQTKKRITILLVKIDDETKQVLKDLLDLEATNKVTGKKTKLFFEINQKEANEILVMSTPQANQAAAKKGLPSANLSETKTLLIYPPPPHKGGITITTDDYICLKEEQFLNDVVIEFYIKWIFLKKLTAEDRERTHMFSTFFYKRLTSKPKKGSRLNSSEENPDLTQAQKRHARVKLWTKNVNIFEKDFVLIPINEHSHWFLAVICFPGLDGPIDITDGQPVQASLVQQSNVKSKSKTKIEIPLVDDVEWSDRDEAEGDDDELDYEDEEEDKEKEPKKLIEAPRDDQPNMGSNIPIVEDAGGFIKSTENNQERGLKTKTVGLINLKQPCILIFDSLSGASRCKIVATLRDYLTVEYFEKKKERKIFSKDNMKGACPKVPQQTNYSDCGIFTLQFAESFFENKIKSFKLPIKTLGDWFPQELVARKRENIAKLIKDLMDEFKPNHGITLPVLGFSTVKAEPSLTSETRKETTEATTSNIEGQVTPGSSDEVQTKRKVDELNSSDNVTSISLNVDDPQLFKSRKLNVNFNEVKGVTNVKSGEIRKVTKPTNNIIIQKSNKFTCTGNQTVNISKGINNVIRPTSSFTNVSENKVVMVGCLPNQSQLITTKNPSFIGTKLEKVEPKSASQSFQENFLASQPPKSPPRRFEIRDEDTSEVLLIFNAPSTNDESTDCHDGSSNVTSTGSNSSITVTCVEAHNKAANSQVQDDSFPQSMNQVKVVSSSSKNCDAVFDMLMQSNVQNQSNIGLYTSGTPTQQSIIRPSRPNPSTLNVQSQSNWPKSQSNTFQPESSLPSSVTARFVVSQPSSVAYSSYQTVSASNSPQLTYTRSPTGPKMYGSAVKNLPSNAQTVTSSCNMKESGLKYVYGSSIDKSSNIKFVNTVKGKSCPVTSFPFSSTTTFPSPTYTSASAPLNSYVSCNVASISRVPSGNQASFNVTHKDPNSKSEDMPPYVQAKFAPDIPPIQGTNLSTNSLVNNRLNLSNHSSNVSRLSNTIPSTPPRLLSQLEQRTAMQSPPRTKHNVPNTLSATVPLVRTCSTLSSCYGSSNSTIVSAGRQSSQPLAIPGGTNLNNKTSLPSMTSKDSSNLYSSTILPSATTITEPQNSLSQSATNVSKGPFSQSHNSTYSQYPSSDSQLISDSELLLSFASQSAVVSPCINLTTQASPSPANYVSSNFSSSTQTDNANTISFPSSIPLTSQASIQPTSFPSQSNQQSFPSQAPSTEINRQSVNSGWPGLVEQCKLSNTQISLSKTASKFTGSRSPSNDSVIKNRVATMDKFKSKHLKQIKTLKPEKVKSKAPLRPNPFSRVSAPVTYGTSRATPKLLNSKNTVDISPSKSRIATSFATQANTSSSPVRKNSNISSSTDEPQTSLHTPPYCYPPTASNVAATEYPTVSSTPNLNQSSIKTDSHVSASNSPLLASALVSSHSPVVHCSHYAKRFFPLTSTPASSFATSVSPSKSDSSMSSPTTNTSFNSGTASQTQSPLRINNSESLTPCVRELGSSDVREQSHLQQQGPKSPAQSCFNAGLTVPNAQSPSKHDCHSTAKLDSAFSPGDPPLVQSFFASPSHIPCEYPNPVGKHSEEESLPSSPTLNQTPPLDMYTPPSPPVFTPNRTTSSGRNVSIPKRYLDSEQEQFYQHTKKRKEKKEKGSSKKRKAEKLQKLNYALN